MPVVSEGSERRRPGSRRWLVAGGVLFGLLIVLPLVPFVTPVTLHVGDRWLRVHTFWSAAASDRDPLSWGAMDEGMWHEWSTSERPAPDPRHVGRDPGQVPSHPMDEVSAPELLDRVVPRR